MQCKLEVLLQMQLGGVLQYFWEKCSGSLGFLTSEISEKTSTEFWTLSHWHLGDAPELLKSQSVLNHFILIEVCSADMLVTCLRISPALIGDFIGAMHLWEHFGRTDKNCPHNVLSKNYNASGSFLNIIIAVTQSTRFRFSAFSKWSNRLDGPNRRSLVFSERSQLSQFHVERMLNEWTPIARFESQHNERGLWGLVSVFWGGDMTANER